MRIRCENCTTGQENERNTLGEQAFHRYESSCEGVQVRLERFAGVRSALAVVSGTRRQLSMVNLTTNAIQCLVGHLVAAPRRAVAVPEEIKVCHPKRRVGRFNAKTNAISIEATQTHSEPLNIVGLAGRGGRFRSVSSCWTAAAAAAGKQ